MRWLCSEVLLWMIIGIILNSPAGAGTLGHLDETEKSYDFNSKHMKGYGAEVNADITRLEQLFGTASDWDALFTSQGGMEEKGWLGIAMRLPHQPLREPDSDKEVQAIVVGKVMRDSAAETVGLQEGDLITGIDGNSLESKDNKAMLAFQMAISKKRPGDKVKLSVLRKAALLELEATLTSYPRVKSALKAHPDLENKRAGSDKSLLHDVLEREGLTGQFAQLLKQYRNETDKVVSPMVRKDDFNPFRLQEVNYVMNNPLQLPVVARQITDRLHGAFGKTHHDLASLARTAMDELDMGPATAKRYDNKPPADWAEYIERLLKAIQHANSERTAVLSVLDAGEIDFLYATAPTLVKGEPDSLEIVQHDVEKKNAESVESNEEKRWLRFFQIVLKLDMPRLLNAATEVAQALDLDTLAKLEKNGKLGSYPKGRIVRKEKNLTVIDTPAGRVLIGGIKDNIYTEDATLIIDFGGNDKYFNHAGGSTRSNPFSVVIDLSGDDVYSATEDFSQGAGLLGGGFLIDLQGNDRYLAKNHSQGAGVLGVGILADLADRDQYTAITSSQGAGSFGFGVLAEGGGDDNYFGNYFIQGVGGTQGFGAIVEAGGNDNYFAGGLFEDFRAPGKSYQSMSQGYGFGIRPEKTFVGTSGGIGVIAEAEGNDTYVADYFAQGSSYWYSLGILDDRKGNDRYVSGRYSQGAGIHSSAGVLIDGEGDDNYLADYGVAQGCGHDFGIGFLLDNGGNDRYIAGVIAQGAGNDNGIGVLSDNGGDDEYVVKSHGQGRGNFEPSRGLGSFGFLFDTGGTDVYSLGGKNNHISYKSQWGILVDTD